MYRSHQVLLFHYAFDAVLLVIVAFSIFQIVQATTPNPGHPWSELGDGVFVFTNSQTATPYTYTFPAASATVLTTNAAVTIAQGGLGGTTALQSARRNATDTAYEAFTPGDMLLAGVQTVTGAKTFNDTKLLLAGSSSGVTTLSATNGTTGTMVFPAAAGTLVNSVTAGNGVSATNTGGALSFTLGAIVPSTVNGLTLSSLGTGFSIAGGTTSKTLTISKTMTLTSAGDSGVLTLPNATDTLAGIGQANTWTGIQTFNNGKLSLAGSSSGNILLNAAATAGTNTTITFPATAGTVALTSDIPSVSGFVPYTGATGGVNLGGYSLTTPNIIGGSTTTSPLTFQTTTGVGTTGADMHFKVGNNGGTEALTILNSGSVGVGTVAPGAFKLNVNGDAQVNNLTFSNPGFGVDSRLTFTKLTDAAWISVNELSSDSTEFGFNMSDNPDQPADKFYWKMSDWQGAGGVWTPLQFNGLNAQIAAANINAYGNYNVYGPWYSSDGVPNTIYTSKTGTINLTPNASAYNSTSTVYWFKIDGTGSPNTFSWGVGSTGGAATATGVAITGAAQTISNGLTVTFSATTGGVLNDLWQFRVSSGGNMRVSNGLVSAPSISFTGDTNSGLYLNAADKVSLVTGGSDRLIIDSGGNVGIGVTSPNHTLEVNGDISVVKTGGINFRSDTSSVNGDYVINYGGDASPNLRISGADDNSIHRYIQFGYYASDSRAGAWNPKTVIDSYTGNVGIGVTSPTSFILQTAGNVGPNADSTYDLGSSSLKWNNLYVAGATIGNSVTRSVTRTLTGVVNDVVNIGSFTFTNGAGSLWVSITVPSSAYSVAKEYIIPIQYNQNGNVWQTVLPNNSTGVYGGNDFALEIKVGTTDASLRIRNVSGSNAGTAYVDIKQEGLPTDSFTPSTTNTTAGVLSSIFSSTSLTQVAGNVGVGINPTAALHLKAGTATAGTAPLKFTTGTPVSPTEAGTLEFDNSHLWFTVANGGTRYQLDQQAASSIRLDQIAAANTTATIDSLTNSIAWNWSTASTQNPFSMSANALTSGKLLSLSSSATTTLTTAGTNVGSLLDITESGAMTAFTGSLASINASGANAVGATGNALNINIAGTAQLMKGIKMNTATTGNLGTTAGTSGAVLFGMNGAHTGYGFQVSDATATGTAMVISANAITTGTGLLIPHTTSVIASGGSMVRISSTSNDTSTTTGALLDLSSTASTGGTQFLQTYSGLTTGIGQSIVSNSLSSGSLLSLSSSGTAALTGQDGIAVSLSGANGTASQTTYGINVSNAHAGTSSLDYGGYFSATGNGTTSTNVGLYSTATGGTTANYAAIFDQGNVGIGTTTPGYKLEVSGGGISVGSGESHFYQGTYTDPIAGVLAAVKISQNAGGTASAPFTAGLTGTSSANINTYGGYFNNTSTVSGTGRNYGLYVVGDGNYFAGNVGIATTVPTNLISLGGTVARTIWMERNTTTATAGQGLTLSSGGAIAGTNNLVGGDLTLKSGISTGTGDSAIHFFTATAGSSGSSDNNPTEKMTILGSGKVLLGATSDPNSSTSKLYISGSTSSNGSSSAIAGVLGDYTFTNGGNAGYVQVGNRFVVTNSPTTNSNTAVGELIRMVDGNTGLSNTIRGLDVTANGGTNTAGTNTGIRSSGSTFGIQGVTSAVAGAVSAPAAIYGESTGTTQGDVLRLYSNTMTSATSFATFYHTSSTFTGTGLLMDFAAGSGTFSGDFINLKKGGASFFKVTNAGIVSMHLPDNANVATAALCSTVGPGNNPAAGTSYELRDCSGAPVADYAEMYPVEKGIEYGDIVAIGTEMIPTYDTGTNGEIDWNKVKGNISKLVKSQEAYQKTVIGIVSNNKNDFSSTGYNIKEGDNPMPVALNGRVPVKVSPSSSPIKTGDYITTSMDSGMATRALKSGFVIGKALEDWSPSSGQTTIMIFIEQGYYESDSAHEFANETTFNGLTFFNANVEFAKSVKFSDAVEFTVPPLWNSDTAGFAVIKRGSDRVDVVFDRAYISTPVVNTTIAFDKIKNQNGENISFDSKSFFNDDIKSLVIDKDENGFAITINKPAPQDLRFSWIALSVKDPKVFESVISGLVIEPTSTSPVVTPPTNLVDVPVETQTASVVPPEETTTPPVTETPPVVVEPTPPPAEVTPPPVVEATPPPADTSTPQI